MTLPPQVRGHRVGIDRRRVPARLVEMPGEVRQGFDQLVLRDLDAVEARPDARGDRARVGCLVDVIEARLPDCDRFDRPPGEPGHQATDHRAAIHAAAERRSYGDVGGHAGSATLSVSRESTAAVSSSGRMRRYYAPPAPGQPPVTNSSRPRARPQGQNSIA